MKGNFKAKHALAVLSNVSLPSADKARADKWQRMLAEQLDELHRQERLTPRRAIAIGLMLHAVKASLKHGEFTPWLKQTLTALKFGTLGTAQVKASYYMRLAIAFVEETKLTAPELAVLSSTGLQLNLEAGGVAAKLIKRLDEFCGDMSLPELIAAHVKNGGGGGGGGGNNPAADSATDWLMHLRQTYLDPDKVKIFPAQHLKHVEQQAASFLSEYRKLLAQMSV